MKKALIVALIFMLSLSVFTACGLTTQTDFTDVEKALISDTLGDASAIPFMKGKEYSIDMRTLEESREDMLNGDVGEFILYCPTGVSYDEFIAYCGSLENAGYQKTNTRLDSFYFTPIFLYEKGDIRFEIGHYTYEGEGVVNAYVWLTGQTIETPDNPGGETPDNPDNPDNPHNPDNPDNPGGGTVIPDNPNNRINVDFLQAEKNKYIALLGEVIPFIPNDEYYVEEDTNADLGDHLCFYTFGNTQAEFDAYRTAIVNAGYVLDGTDVDDYGDTWYFYTKGNIFFDISFYYYEEEYVVDTYAYLNPETTGGNTGGNTGGGTTGGDTGSTSDITHLTNAGKGLPTGTNGVYNVDFTDATYVKYVADQGYYLGGCPTTGDVKVLVIPVDFSDATATGKGYTLDKLDKAFNSNDANDGMFSAYEYFKTSSYGKLNLNFVIPTSWYRANNASTYYESQTDSEGGLIGDQVLLDEVLKSYAQTMDLSEFDSDDNGLIDAVVIVNTLDVADDDFHWAYRYWNQYFDNNGDYYVYDGVSANDYLWASYQFLHETYDEDGNVAYTDTTACNTYTFIHEFSHVLGADDYYDTSYTSNTTPLEGADMMDSMFGDHNPYTKFNYGWLTTSRLVVAEDTVTLTLEDFTKNGDTIIVANNWDATLGAYQEYYVLMYYTENGANAGDEYGFFAREGVLVYHVNASLYKEVLDGETYYDVYNNNTNASDEYGTENNLIEFVKTAGDTFTYVAGDTSPTIIDDNGKALAYSFVIDSIEGDTATITFTKNNN